LIATAIIKAAQRTNMPDGVFSMVHGGAKVGLGLVNNPHIKAVGFTGSFRVGKALFDAAAKRHEPIPVYAEMGSVNPVFVLPEAVKNNGQTIAQGFSNSVNMGVGQFCTNPGMLIVENQADSDAFFNHIKTSFDASVGGTMLTEGIQKAYQKGVSHTQSLEAVTLLSEGKAAGTHTGITPVVFKAAAKDVLTHKALSEEVFGPMSVVVLADDKTDILKIAEQLEGHLTATLFGTPKDLLDNKELIDVLEQKVGRLIINAFPTGVEVCYSMVHGGPFPATTGASSTSVGTNAIYRFTRPVCYQGFPDDLLPDELKESNPLSISRKINGKYV
jgi:2,5-dioxopentanoate dehydrogenase